MVGLLGSRDELLRIIEEALASDIHVRGNEITISGDPADNALAVRLFEELLELRRGRADAHRRLRRAHSLGMLAGRRGRAPGRGAQPQHPVPARAEHPAEDAEPEAVRRRDRPAHDRLRHRPGRHRQDLPGRGQGRAGAAGQAGQPDHPDPAGGRGGERLGFLPGTLYDKIDPYLRPLLRRAARHGRPGLDPAAHQAGTIEIAPLAYMRGRTLNDAFIILDEAQNTTPEQMKMFLTRLGFGSQDRRHRRRHADRPARRAAQRPAGGAGHPRRRRGRPLRRLTSTDVVRHRLVGDIVDAYERYDAQVAQPRPAPEHPRRPAPIASARALASPGAPR